MLLRIKFNKEGSATYISHLDLLRTFNRIIKRSGIDASYSQGFNPHYVLNFIYPSSVGMVSKNDCCELKCEGNYTPDEVFSMMKKAAPPGITFLSVTENLEPSFKQLAAAEYNVKIYSNKKSEDFIKILESNEILIDKKTKKGIKEVDISPLIKSFKVKDEENYTVFNFILSCGNEKNLNPMLIIKAFLRHIDGLLVDNYKIVRENLISDSKKLY